MLHTHIIVWVMLLHCSLVWFSCHQLFSVVAGENLELAPLRAISARTRGGTLTYTGGASNYTILSIHQSDYHKSETVRYILGEGILSTLP